MVVIMENPKVSKNPNFRTAGAPVPLRLRNAMNQAIREVSAPKNSAYAAALTWFVNQTKEVQRQWIDAAMREWIKPALGEAPTPDKARIQEVERQSLLEVSALRKRSKRTGPKRKQLPPDPPAAAHG